MIRSTAIAPIQSLCAVLGAALLSTAAPALADTGADATTRTAALAGAPAAVLAASPLPRPRPAAVGELSCLARALYHEARGEGEQGMRAVAEVVLNRAESPRFPDSICAVVEQGAGNGRGCQFSFVCDGSERRRLEPRSWSLARALAREMVRGAPRRLTDGATHFHTVAVAPHWSRVYELTAEIGAHRFYRKPVEVASN